MSMISVKMALVIVAAFAAGAFFASPVPQAIASTIANDVICSGCIGTSDLAGNAVTSAKIKDGEVKTADIATGAVASGRIADGAVGTLKIANEAITAADIGPDAVGAAELIGVTKLLFAECMVSDSGSVSAGFFDNLTCPVPGADGDDQAIVTANTNNICFLPDRAYSATNSVQITMKNTCTSSAIPGTVKLSVIVFDT